MPASFKYRLEVEELPVQIRHHRDRLLHAQHVALLFQYDCASGNDRHALPGAQPPLLVEVLPKKPKIDLPLVLVSIHENGGRCREIQLGKTHKVHRAVANNGPRREGFSILQGKTIHVPEKCQMERGGDDNWKCG